MYDEDLANLEEWLRRLKIEYHIFFSGNRKKPPDDLKLRVEKLVKKLSECSDMSASQRFRFTTLITRFYVYRDLWRRTLQEKEMGTHATAKTAPEAPCPSSPDKSRADAFRISITNPEVEGEKVQELYRALVHLKQPGGNEKPISYEQFARYIAAQTQGIRKKYGCPAVAFTIALENDSVRFTAAADKS